jgi:biofilm protein TabA
MILDAAPQFARYTSLHPLLPRVLPLLDPDRLLTLAPGRHAVDGERLYLSIEHASGRGRDGARLEAHRRYLDVQYTIAGTEEIGWTPLADAGPSAGGYDAARDIAFYGARPHTWLSVPPGSFAIFFPDDAHAPLAAAGPVKKLIVKIAV